MKSSSARDEEMGSQEEVEEEEEEGEKYIFCMTWIELGLGLLISAAWICTSPVRFLRHADMKITINQPER